MGWKIAGGPRVASSSVAAGGFNSSTVEDLNPQKGAVLQIGIARTFVATTQSC